MDCDADADTSHVRVLPDTCVELFVNFTSTPVAIIGDQLYKRSIISFRMSRSIDVQMPVSYNSSHPGLYNFVV